jgi:hypothetical protein
MRSSHLEGTKAEIQEKYDGSWCEQGGVRWPSHSGPLQLREVILNLLRTVVICTST